MSELEAYLTWRRRPVDERLPAAVKVKLRWLEPLIRQAFWWDEECDAKEETQEAAGEIGASPQGPPGAGRVPAVDPVV